MGCFQPGRMPSATLPPDIEPAQPRMLSHTPVSPSTAQAFEPTPVDSYGIPSLTIDPWKPSVPPRNWTWIVIHHTASSHGSVESIHAAHLQRRDRNGNPWRGIGYHFVIGNGNGMEDGEIEPTFRWRQQLPGAHAGEDEHNQHGIGIALVGNFELGPPTPAKWSPSRGWSPSCGPVTASRRATCCDTATSKPPHVRENTSRWETSPKGGGNRCWETERQRPVWCRSPHRKGIAHDVLTVFTIV